MNHTSTLLAFKQGETHIEPMLREGVLSPREWAEVWIGKLPPAIVGPSMNVDAFASVLRPFLTDAAMHPAKIPGAYIRKYLTSSDPRTRRELIVALSALYHAILKPGSPELEERMHLIEQLSSITKDHAPVRNTVEPEPKVCRTARLTPGADGTLEIHFEYNAVLVEKARLITGRIYDEKGRFWRIPDKGPETLHEITRVFGNDITASSAVYENLLVHELKARKASPRTIENYLRGVSGYIPWLGRAPKPEDKKDIQKYAIHLLEARNLDPSTINLYVTGIRFLYREVLGYRTVEEKFRRMKETRKIPRFYSREYIERILNATSNEKHQLVLLLTYGSGLRLEEIGKLCPADVDFSRNVVRILGKGSKEREVPVDPEVAGRVRDYIKGREKDRYIFEGAEKGHPYNRRTIGKIYENACKKAGIERLGGIHTLRHSYATHLRQAGVDLRVIQTLLGHSSIKTTQIYTHVGNEEIEKIVSPLRGMNFKRKAGKK